MLDPLAPIAIFGYRREEHFRNCWQSLAKNPEAVKSELYVFLDAAKNSEMKVKTDLVYDQAKSIRGFKSIQVIKNSTHLGLSRSILKGLQYILEIHPKIIVVEDDLIVAPHFLRYLNEAIFIYEKNPQVASIHGYVYPTQQKMPETFFLKGADCWGWATWRSAWAHFEQDGRVLLQQLQKKKLELEFDLGGVAPFTEMLKSQISGRNDSWAIRWHASAFLAGLYTLYPGQSLVKNVGQDNSGTHSGSTGIFDVNLSSDPVRVKPIPVEESKVGRMAFEDFFRLRNKT